MDIDWLSLLFLILVFLIAVGGLYVIVPKIIRRGTGAAALIPRAVQSGGLALLVTRPSPELRSSLPQAATHPRRIAGTGGFSLLTRESRD
jgi:hypothetical protein